MKRYFVETDGYNLVVYVDDSGKGFICPDMPDNYYLEPIDLESAKMMDYSNLNGCETVEECCAACGCSNDYVHDWNKIVRHKETVYTEF